MHELFIYIKLDVYEFVQRLLNLWSRNPINNFKLKDCLFGIFKLTRNTIKIKFISNWQGIAFDRADSWSFGNNFARNVIVFAVDNSSSIHSENCENIFLVFGKGPTDDINGSVGTAETKFSIY